MRKGVLSTRSTRSSGEIAYHYSYLQSGRALRKGVLSTRTSRSSGEIIVTRGTGYETASFKGLNKGAAIYVESTTTVHNLLFYVRTLAE